MESGDGGAEENSERPKDVDGQPQQEQTELRPPEGTGRDVLNESRAELQQVEQISESREIEPKVEDGEAEVINNDADNFTQQEVDSDGAAMVASAQETLMDKRRVSDEESGENVVLSEVTDFPSSSERSLASNQTAKEEGGILSLCDDLAHQDTGVEANANDNTAEESSLVKDADGTVKEGMEFSAAFSDQSSKLKGKGQEDVDEELENFFQSAQAEVGKFPALDNVDLTSDEDGQEGNGVREGVTEENGEKFAQDNQGVVQSDDVAAVPREEDCYDDQGIVEVKRSDRKDYPLNYGNYTVCREVEPGVKECLILETGEHVVCVANMAALSTSTLTSSKPFSSSSPRNIIIKKNDCDGINSVPFVNPAEAFAYVSFQGDAKLSLEDDVGVSSQPLVLDENQQAFITENGIPVILDNAEDDVKLGLQVKMDQLGKYVHDDPSPTSGEVEAKSSFEPIQVRESERVADVLSSGGEGDSRCQFNESTRVKKSKKKKDKKQRFYELQPDDVEDDTDDADRRVALNSSNNSIHQNERESDNENLNNNAFEREAKRILRSPHGNLHSHDVRNQRFLSSDVSGSDRVYSPAARKTAFNDSGRHFTSGLESSYSRYGDRSSFDSSHMSTRYSRIDRGDPSSSSSAQESLTIPRFRTLHDQQVSWLEMFKMIEDQHRNELQSQYSEHQRILRDLQHNMELELTKQQDTLKHRLQTHKEILQELSPGRSRLGRDVTYSPRTRDAPREDLSRTTIDGVPVTLKYPPPLSGHFAHTDEDQAQGDHRKRESLGQAPVRRSLEKELSSPSRRADTSLNLSEASVSGDKLLRGGVYSSPMPLAKARQKRTKSGRSHENKSHNSVSDKLGHAACYGDHVSSSYGEERTNDASLTESDDITSPRSRVSLREKHAKHVADLRAYYEEELKEMRKILTSRQTGDDLSGDNALAAGDRILTNENAELRQRCQELDDECHDLKIEIRELQQKIQGLDIRAADYAQRFDNSQSQVRSLHTRLEELTEFAKEKEAEATDLKSKNKSSGDTLQLAYKKEKELTDSLHAAKTTIQRLVEKYESLEKDQQLLKESLADKDEKLFLSRKEAMDANNKISRMELENKQLLHDKDILKHELTMARSSVANIHTTFEDAFPNTVPSSSSRISRNALSGIRSRSTDRSNRSLSRDRNRTQADPSPDSETESEFSKSPIIRAEKELMKLRESVGSSQEFAPKLQRKFYGTETSTGSLRGSTISSPGHSSKSKGINEIPKSSSPRDKRGRGDNINGIKTSSIGHASTQAAAQSGKSLSRRSESNLTKHRQSDRINEGNTPAERAVQGALKRLGVENGWSSEQVLERVKAGEVVSRPAWEDMYTSMAPARTTGPGEKTSSTVKSTRDQMLIERLQNIDMLERKYDDLSNEKRKFEAALSKVPAHGSRREKERLEAELDRVDRDLGSVRMSLKRFHVLKSTI